MLIDWGRRCEGVQDLYKRSRMPLAEGRSAQSRGEDSLEWGKADGDDDCAHLPERRGSGRRMSMEQECRTKDGGSLMGAHPEDGRGLVPGRLLAPGEGRFGLD